MFFPEGWGPKPRKKTQRSKARAKPKPKPKPVDTRVKAKRSRGTKACLASSASLSTHGSRSCTKRSPGGMLDPKADAAMIEEALALVGTPKLRRNVAFRKDGKKTVVDVTPSRSYGFPADAAYLTVAFGGGVDSTAVLVGLDQLWRETRSPKWIPVVVTFADTGGEHPETYDFVRLMDRWLKRAFRGGPHHPGSVVKVAYSTLQRGGGWGTGYTLEQQSLVNQSLPSISLGGHSCSTKYKIDAQQQWFKRALADGTLPAPGGRRIVRAIGYDATEVSRLEGHSTYVAGDEEKADSVYRAWYPLIEWGWDRARCLAEIHSAMGTTPRKSSCWFCGAMRPEEIVLLARQHPDLLERAIFMENVAMHGRHRPHGGLGINGSFNWTDFVLGNVDALPPSKAVYVVGGVVRQTTSKAGRVTTRVVKGTMGKPRPGQLGPGESYVEAVGQLMSERKVRGIVAKAKAYVAAAPDRGGIGRGKVVKGAKGQLGKDMALHPLTDEIPAFCDVQGFRAEPGALSWNTLLDGHLTQAQRKGDAVTVKKILAIDARTTKGSCGRGRVSANPRLPRRLPVAYSSPLLTGL